MNANKNVLGLMTVWSEIKHNYPYQNKLEKLDWDNIILNYIERVLKASTIEEYYTILMEFASLVNDGHTNIIPPWEYIVPNHNKPAIEVEIIEDKVVICRIGNKKENIDNKLCIGDEILSIDGIPVFEKLSQINKIYARGSVQANNVINMFYLLMGPMSENIKLQLKKIDGPIRNIELQRLFIEDDGNYFLDRIIDLKTPLKITLFDNTALIKITAFSDKEIAEKVNEIIFSKEITNLIFDVRFNMGGNDQIAYTIISSLIDKEVSSPIYKYKTGSPALRNWGIADEWNRHSTSIQPAELKETKKHIYVLTNGATSSTAEDFAIVLKFSKRATIVGTKTAGSSGNPYTLTLPYKGKLRVSTFKASTPENLEYVGVGIDPNFEVNQTHRDLINGIDTPLEFVKNLIKKTK